MAALTDVLIEVADSWRFAELSGDFNPLHVDPISARRLVFGEAVPHGVHLLMLALDRAVQHTPGNWRLQFLKATFATPATHGVPVVIEAEDGGSALRLTLRQNRTILQTVVAEFTDSAERATPLIEHRRFLPEAPRLRSLRESAGAAERLGLCLDPELAEAMFPNLVRAVPSWQAALLLATTRLVGMRCPGLHSIFAALELHFAGSAASALDYVVRRTEQRLNLLAIDVGAEGVRGRITALVRPPAVPQPSAAELRPLLRADEFLGRRALVVGGSRGLGELAAKILALGGAEVWLSYARGSDDAAAVVADIRGQAGRATAFRLDITELSENEPLPGLPAISRPTHLYLFATPRIRFGRGRRWDPELFANYCRYYVCGVAAVTAGIDAIAGGHAPLHLFYPSTAYLDQPPPGTAEYVAAKAAGEALCRSLAALRPDLSIHCPRLPPLKTDQTAALTPIAGRVADAVPTLLAELRA